MRFSVRSFWQAGARGQADLEFSGGGTCRKKKVLQPLVGAGGSGRCCSTVIRHGRRGYGTGKNKHLCWYNGPLAGQARKVAKKKTLLSHEAGSMWRSAKCEAKSAPVMP